MSGENPTAAPHRAGIAGRGLRGKLQGKIHGVEDEPYGVMASLGRGLKHVLYALVLLAMLALLCGVRDWDVPTGVVAGESHPSNGAYAVADPRCRTDWGGAGKYLVTPPDQTAGTVIAESTTGNGAFAIADPRPTAWLGGRANFTTGGHYGVVRLDQPSGTVVGKAKHDTGPWSVADWRMPDPKDRPEETPLIISLDGTWHRPFTTLEMAALQGFPWAALGFGGGLDGKSDAKHRERIGNAVPPPAAMAMASVMGRAILAARAGVTFELSMEPVWVQPLATALSLPVGMGGHVEPIS